jgi:molybdate transport system permease protein
MDWPSLLLSLELAAWTLVVLIPLAIAVARWLAWSSMGGKAWIEGALALPLVLPPTVLGYYLLVSLGAGTPLGEAWRAVFGQQLVFSFHGLVIASVIFNIPFAVQPAQRAFEAIAPDIRHAAACCGLGAWETFWRIELPLAWPGIVSAVVLTFAHTLGEFGVVLMVGGSIPGETKTVAISIYDRVQAMDTAGAGAMSLTLLAITLAAMAVVHATARRGGVRHG